MRGQHVGFVFQSFQLLASLTALENVMLPVELRGDTMAQSQARELLEKVGLADRLDHYPRQLSGGEQQRVAIARAFASKPTVLFADEPTGNLDTQTGELICQLLFDLNTEFGTTLVMVTHDLALAARCGRTIAIAGGRIVPQRFRRGSVMNLRLVARMAWQGCPLRRNGSAARRVVGRGWHGDVHRFVRRSAAECAAGRVVQFFGSRPANFRQSGDPEAFVQQAQQRGLNTAQTLVFPSMVFAGDLNQLVSVKAVDAAYPLRGDLIVGSEPFQRGAPTDTVPEPGTVWLDSRLFPAMNLGLGDTIEVGMAELTVASVLIAEPDRGGSFFDLGPRLLMNMQDVAATEVVQPEAVYLTVCCCRRVLKRARGPARGTAAEARFQLGERAGKQSADWTGAGSGREFSALGRFAWRVACRHCGGALRTPLCPASL